MQIETIDLKSLFIELENWGWWAQEDDTRKLDFSSGETSGGKRIAITDSRALELDRAIATLSARPKRAMKLRFICGFDPHRIATAFNIPEETATQLVDNSVMRINDYLLTKLVA
jgi:DNA-directed RNA polymerase specialized sigma24 family protein